MGQRLGRNSGDAQRGFDFFVVTDPTLNAFAGPGGNIGVNSGLILTTRTEDELASVKFSRLTQRGVLLGLSGSQLVVVGFGAIMLVFALYFGGGPSLMYVVPVLLLCASLAFIGVGSGLMLALLAFVALRATARRRLEIRNDD